MGTCHSANVKENEDNDVQRITATLKKLMGLVFKTTTDYWQPKAVSAQSARVAPLDDILQLTIITKMVTSGVSYAQDATPPSLGLWIHAETLAEHIDTWEKTVNEFEKFLEKK